MSQKNSLSSFRYDDTDPTIGRYPDFTPVPLPITDSPSGSLLEQSLPNTSGHPATRPQTWSVAGSDQLVPASGPLHDVSTTQSLIAALQSTMGPSTTRTPVVIPGSRKRGQIKTTEELKTQRRMSPRLRFGITLGVIVVVMVTTLISLAPLGGGQNTSTLLGGTLEWVRAQQENRGIVGHTFVTLAQANSAQATTAQTTTNTAATLPYMPLSTSAYVAIARQDAIANGISPDYFVRQIQAESGFNPNAYSPAGAVGIAQFLPSTAAGLGIDPYNPISALAGAAQYMASYAKQYNGNYAMALAAYNAGGGAVQYAVAAGGANWMNFLPAETRQYIYKIMGI